MATAKKMDVTKPDTATLVPRSKDKFAYAGHPGRVINAAAETNGGGRAQIQLNHPDGVQEILAEVNLPDLAKGETCVLQVRVAAGIRKTVAEGL